MKTTQFGAFVELKKGTDGLLHVSNVGRGRGAHIEDVMARGDVGDVVVQEVDKDRGRIGLKLVAKHENGGLVMPEDLIANWALLMSELIATPPSGAIFAAHSLSFCVSFASKAASFFR